MNISYKFSRRISHFKELSSTNDYFKFNPEKCDFIDGEVVITNFQITGKGLGNNTWKSEAGQNLIFSLYLKNPNIKADKQFYLSKAISIAVCNYLRSFGYEFEIKWPNDIYFDRNKIAGILIENTIQANNITESIVGIGLNVNQITFNDLPNPISLKMIAGNDFSLKDELINLLSYIDSQLKVLYDHKFSDIDNQYLNCLYLYNKWSSFISKGKTFKGKITGVSEFGYLLMINDNNKKLQFGFKEVEYVASGHAPM